jgi:hypothetical protein
VPHKHHAKLVFKLFDRLRLRCLRDTLCDCRAAKVFLAREGNQHFEFVDHQGGFR